MMKRLLTLIFALLMLSATVIAEEERSARLASELLPEYTFLDGVEFDKTAMFLVADTQGRTRFAGCVREDGGWTVTLSTAMPDWLEPELDIFHAGEGSMRLYCSMPADHVDLFTVEWWEPVLDVYIDLLSDGTWRVRGLNNGWEVIEFRRNCVYRDVGIPVYGDLPGSFRIEEVDWESLPLSMEDAIRWVDMSGWMIVSTEYAPVYAEPATDSDILSLGAAGAPVRVLSTAEGMVQVTDLGGSVTGWMVESDLLPAGEQMVWDEEYGWENRFTTRELILEDDDPAVPWCAAPHAQDAPPFPVTHVEYVTLLGFCPQRCCYHLYSETLGTSAFVPMAQLPYTLE